MYKKLPQIPVLNRLGFFLSVEVHTGFRVGRALYFYFVLVRFFKRFKFFIECVNVTAPLLHNGCRRKKPRR